MKYLLPILCLFIFSCDDDDSPTAPVIEGCIDESACNYDDTATLDDGSCTYVGDYDCNGNCLFEFDECGICNGSDNNDDGYCQVDLDVLQDIMDVNSISGTYNLWNGSPIEITPLTLCWGGDCIWTDGRLEVLFLNYYENSGIPEITYIPESIGNLSELNTLEIRYNPISIIPESIGNLENLIDFNAEGTQIEYIPDSICSLSNLLYLRFDNCNLIELPSDIGNMPNLYVLHVMNNELVSLPESICNLYDDSYSINFQGNNLCNEFSISTGEQFGCNTTASGQFEDNGQDQSNCCEGVNDEGEIDPNWTTCP